MSTCSSTASPAACTSGCHSARTSGLRRGDKRMKLRYAGTCRLCGGDLPARQEAIYERATKSVRCVECPTAMVAPDAEPGPEVRPEPAAPGVAGASARQEYERRTARREERIRAKHPKTGGVILALSDDPQTTRAWASGAKGEVALGARLDEHASETIAVMHDRLIPGTKANIDHIVVTAGGVLVVDAKRYVDKRPELRVEGGFLRPRRERLWSADGTGRSSLTAYSARWIGSRPRSRINRSRCPACSASSRRAGR